MLAHEFFLDKEVYCVARYTNVNEEGPTELIFVKDENDEKNGKGGWSGEGQANQEYEVQGEVPAISFSQNIQPDDQELTSAAQDGVIDRDNGNESVPENPLNRGLSVNYCQYNDE